MRTRLADEFMQRVGIAVEQMLRASMQIVERARAIVAADITVSSLRENTLANESS